jgi:hypothetical protein
VVQDFHRISVAGKLLTLRKKKDSVALYLACNVVVLIRESVREYLEGTDSAERYRGCACPYLRKVACPLFCGKNLNVAGKLRTLQQAQNHVAGKSTWYTRYTRYTARYKNLLV